MLGLEEIRLIELALQQDVKHMDEVSLEEELGTNEVEAE